MNPSRRVFVPADNLGAWWDWQTRSLVLHASGTRPFGVEDIHFERAEVHIPEEPAFHLVGWIRGNPTDGYFEVTDRFKMGFPVNGQITVTVQGPDGGPLTKILKIPQIDSVNATQATSSAVSVSSLPTDPKSASVSAAPRQRQWRIPIFVTIGQPFELFERPKGPEAIVSIKHDDQALKLETAGFSNGELVWTFVGKKVGYTHVYITNLSIPGWDHPTVIEVSVEDGEVHTNASAAAAPATLPAAEPAALPPAAPASVPIVAPAAPAAIPADYPPAPPAVAVAG